MPHPAALDPDRLLADCELRFTRRSGPGGQNRNKVETAVVLTHRPTGTVAEASERRTQGENRASALFRLRLTLAIEHREDPSARPSDLWRSRCHGGRIAINPQHVDFPALLAEALDTLFGCEHDIKRASVLLGSTPSQLVKLLKREPRALRKLNIERDRHGLCPLL